MGEPTNTPGLLVLLGSGETLPSSGKTHEYVASRLPQPPKIVLLETPAGFELNADRVAGKIKDFLEVRLQNYAPEFIQVPARKKGTDLSPDNLEIVTPILEGDEILLGPGSPTFAVRQLKDSLAFEMLKARHRLGATIFLASAATLAFGRNTIPVYEIYKVGEDLHWKSGLDLFGLYGLPVSIVPHWNNNDGGDELDTSHCYIGESRFEALRAMLPANEIFVGIDDHTSLVVDFAEKHCRVMGNGTVHVVQGDQDQTFASGETFSLDLLGTLHIPTSGEGIKPEIWQMALEAQQARRQAAQTVETPPDNVLAIVETRSQAREEKDWGKADQLRHQIQALGWDVMDTPQGPELSRIEE